MSREVMFTSKPGTEPTLEAAYTHYRFTCYGAEPLPERQEFETRQAFIAGIVWMFSFLEQLPDNEDESGKALDKLDADIQAFNAALQATAKARGLSAD